MVRSVARLLWVFPLALVLLAVNQLTVGLELRQTWQQGVSATAVVTDFEKVDRKDVTYGHIGLRVTLPDGSVITKEKMALPYSLLHRLENEEQLAVHVNDAADQEVIIDLVANAHWKMAVIQAAMALVAALMAGVGVFFWNRLLRRRGDPGESSEEAVAPAATKAAPLV